MHFVVYMVSEPSCMTHYACTCTMRAISLNKSIQTITVLISMIISVSHSNIYDYRKAFIQRKLLFRILLITCTCSIISYVFSEHANELGFSSLIPSPSIFGRLIGLSPPYGILPPLNISHTVIPYDHCIMNMK